MAMNDMDETNWPYVRKFVKDWLAEHHRRPIWLAQQAGINRSILSRFLAEKPLDTGSALKVYSVVQRGMDQSEKIVLLRAMGLLPLAEMLHSGLQDTGTFVTAVRGGSCLDSFAAGSRLLAAAFEETQHAWAHTTVAHIIALFHQAEQAFGSLSTIAARAACEAAQMMLNTSDLDRAALEIERIASLYDRAMDVETEMRVMALRGFMHLDRAEMPEALRWYAQYHALAVQGGSAELIRNANHFLGFIYLQLGRQCQRSSERDTLLARSETHLKSSYQACLKLHGEDVLRSETWRLAQLQTELGRYDEARQLRNRARHMPKDIFMPHHLEIDEGEIDLQEGETRSAAIKAEKVLRDWATVGYAQGMARCARILALAAYQEGHVTNALETVIAGVLLDPYASYGRHQKLRDLVTEISEVVIHQTTTQRYHLLIGHLRESALARQGRFAYLDGLPVDRTAALDRLFSELASDRHFRR